MKKKQNERKKTGLNDRKGKEIREGDVVIMEGWKGLLGIVEYQEPHFWVSVHNEKYGAADLIWINWHEEVEVIGNIYDQPELISKAATSKYIYEDNLPFVSFPAHNFFARDAHNRCQASLRSVSCASPKVWKNDFLTFLPDIVSSIREKERMKYLTNKKIKKDDVSTGYMADWTTA